MVGAPPRLNPRAPADVDFFHRMRFNAPYALQMLPGNWRQVFHPQGQRNRENHDALQENNHNREHREALQENNHDDVVPELEHGLVRGPDGRRRWIPDEELEVVD